MEENKSESTLQVGEYPSYREYENRISYLKEKIEMAPLQPGCYLWKNQEGKILYIGKSIKLKHRLRSYFNPDSYKHYVLLQKSYDVEWIVTNTGNEALILEDSLIKQYQPPYNVRLKDDKRYPFICVSLSETYPRVFITRKYSSKDGNRYFGPYTDVKFARRLLDLIHKTFPIRKVNQTLPLKKPRRPCMNFFIQRCLAPCQGNIASEEYQKIVKEVILFLEGRKELLEEIIIKRMNEYSKKLEYEKAAIYRDILFQLKKWNEQQTIVQLGNPDQDIIAIATNEEYKQAQAIVLEFRNSRLISRKSFSLYVPSEVEIKSYQEELLSSFLREYYLHFVNKDNFPARILIPKSAEGIQEISMYLKEKFQYPVQISISHGSSIMKLAEKNAKLILQEQILRKKNRLKKEALKEIQTLCKLKKIPEIIECYDISHFQGSETVGSGIRFMNGEPHTSSYRYYKIKNVVGIHDPESIKEVISRRIRRLKEENRTFPDLIVIDGGITQVNAAYQAIQKHGVSIPLVGLAKKKEELYFPMQSQPLQPDPNSPGMRLLRQMRDEAHRFGNEFQKKRMRKKIYRHILDSIPSIGEKRKKTILKQLENINLQNISKRELLAIEGIGEKIANQILLYIQEQKG